MKNEEIYGLTPLDGVPGSLESPRRLGRALEISFFGQHFLYQMLRQGFGNHAALPFVIVNFLPDG
jgi:hypothetical protein